MSESFFPQGFWCVSVNFLGRHKKHLCFQLGVLREVPRVSASKCAKSQSSSFF